MELRFAQRSVNAHLRTDGLFAPSRGAPAALAYVDLDAVAKRRIESIPMLADDRTNPPVARIRRIKQARVRPPEMLYDPYIAAVLIALAQARRQAKTPGKRISTKSKSGSGSLKVLLLTQFKLFT